MALGSDSGYCSFRSRLCGSSSLLDASSSSFVRLLGFEVAVSEILGLRFGGSFGFSFSSPALLLGSLLVSRFLDLRFSSWPWFRQVSLRVCLDIGLQVCAIWLGLRLLWGVRVLF